MAIERNSPLPEGISVEAEGEDIMTSENVISFPTEDGGVVVDFVGEDEENETGPEEDIDFGKISRNQLTKLILICWLPSLLLTIGLIASLVAIGQRLM